MSEPRPLEDVAREFTAQLADTVSRFLGRDCAFSCSALESGRFNVSDGGTGVVLLIEDTALLTLTIDINCFWDSRETYLAVETSSFKVFAGRQAGEPLFHYDYLRQPTSPDIPCAHLQVAAHRDEFTYAMAYGGTASRRARKRGEQPPGKAPRISAVHFPLGGPRFRPCLEDVLAMIREEFGIDTAADWKTVINEGRAAWRRMQVAAAVRDCPEEAARVLRDDLRYQVIATDETETRESIKRLTQP